MSEHRQYIGLHGEKIAGKYLSSRGFIALERNFKTPFGEIDLITRKGRWLVFVEIKTRISETFGTPLESIDKLKQQHILKNCQYYINRYNLQNEPWRIDAIGIKLNKELDLEVLTYVKNAMVVQ